MALDDDVLKAAAKFFDQRGSRYAADELLPLLTGVDPESVRDALRRLEDDRYLKLLRMWQADVVDGITPAGRKRLAQISAAGKAHRSVWRSVTWTGENVAAALIPGVAVVVLGYLGLR